MRLMGYFTGQRTQKNKGNSQFYYKKFIDQGCMRLYAQLMNAQQIFNTVVRGLRAQGKPSVNAYDCRYRGPDGAKCAAGFLIPDAAYVGSMEAQDWTTLSRLYANSLPEYLSSHTVLIQALQCVHDNWAREIRLQRDEGFPVDAFKHTAERFFLDPSVLYEIEQPTEDKGAEWVNSLLTGKVSV